MYILIRIHFHVSIYPSNTEACVWRKEIQIHLRVFIYRYPHTNPALSLHSNTSSCFYLSGAAKQLSKMEAMRLQNSFSDGVRGLCRYGAKVLIPEAIAVLNYEIGTSGDDEPINVAVTNTVKTEDVTPVTK